MQFCHLVDHMYTFVAVPSCRITVATSVQVLMYYFGVTAVTNQYVSTTSMWSLLLQKDIKQVFLQHLPTINLPFLFLMIRFVYWLACVHCENKIHNKIRSLGRPQLQMYTPVTKSEHRSMIDGGIMR